MELPAEGRVYLDQPVLGAPAYRRSRVFALSGGGTAVRLSKGRAARSLGVVLYADGPMPGAAAELEAIVDGGDAPPRVGGASLAYTRLRRRIPLDFGPLEGARYLNRAQGAVWASAPVFIPLGDNLPRRPPPGRATDARPGVAPMARFFSYGGPVANRISQHVELRAEALTMIAGCVPGLALHLAPAPDLAAL